MDAQTNQEARQLSELGDETSRQRYHIPPPSNSIGAPSVATTLLDGGDEMDVEELQTNSDKSVAQAQKPGRKQRAQRKAG